MPLSDPQDPHYGSYSEARAHFKELLDAAIDGRPATVRRGRQLAAVVDAERFREDLAHRPSRAEVVAEAEGWSVFIPGLPIAADGSTLDDAIEDMIGALREYAGDWPDRLRFAPNHAGNWPIVQLVTLSDDEQLRGWLTGS